MAEILKIADESVLKPGRASYGGFLAEGETLVGVIARDDEVLRILGYSHDEVAVLLESLVSYAPMFRKHQSSNGNIYKVNIQTYRGDQECPWGDRIDFDTSAPNADLTLLNAENAVVLQVAGLLPHLVRHHHFFEGHTQYRTAPEDIVNILGVEKIPGSIQKIKESLS